MHQNRLLAAGAIALAAAISPFAAAQGSMFATQVIASNTNGNAGGGIFLPSNALGAPAGTAHVHSLGIAGDLTLGFSVPIVDGPGADFIVSENAFRLASNALATFAEVVFVEVSSDGVHFARFPSRYFGPTQQPGPFGTVPVGSYSGLAGQTPVLATTPGADPRDVVEAGGDAFDLADLSADPLVQTGLVDLMAIDQVRLVDVVSGQSLDSLGMPIFDPGAGSADIDAVTAIHQLGSVASNGPRVTMDIRVDGTVTLRFEDPDGWTDIDPGTLRAAAVGIPIGAGGLLGGMTLQQADATGFTLVQNVPLPPSLLFTLSFSVKDRAGNRSGITRTRPTF
ncbi:MAG: hypothetical protein NXI31_21885 [bacterium]|nr:hypothetical protein [bacterium]